MNTMTLPGFSADASFKRSGAYYQVGALFASPGRAGRVVPSAKFESGCNSGAGVRVCLTCAGELGCYICSGATQGPLAGAYICFWAGGSQ